MRSVNGFMEMKKMEKTLLKGFLIGFVFDTTLSNTGPDIRAWKCSGE